MCRFVLGILAWTWAICIFVVHYCGSEIEHNQPAVVRQFIVPIFKVLLVAPASFSLANAQAPGSAGHHGSVQAGSLFGPLTRSSAGGLEALARTSYDDLPATAQHLSIAADGQYR